MGRGGLRDNWSEDGNQAGIGPFLLMSLGLRGYRESMRLPKLGFLPDGDLGSEVATSSSQARLLEEGVGTSIHPQKRQPKIFLA